MASYRRGRVNEAVTKKDDPYSDFSVTKPTRQMPERLARIIAERKAGGK